MPTVYQAHEGPDYLQFTPLMSNRQGEMQIAGNQAAVEFVQILDSISQKRQSMKEQSVINRLKAEQAQLELEASKAAYSSELIELKKNEAILAMQNGIEAQKEDLVRRQVVSAYEKESGPIVAKLIHDRDWAGLAEHSAQAFEKFGHYVNSSDLYQQAMNAEPEQIKREIDRTTLHKAQRAQELADKIADMHNSILQDQMKLEERAALTGMLGFLPDEVGTKGVAGRKLEKGIKTFSESMIKTIQEETQETDNEQIRFFRELEKQFPTTTKEKIGRFIGDMWHGAKKSGQAVQQASPYNLPAALIFGQDPVKSQLKDIKNVNNARVVAGDIKQIASQIESSDKKVSAAGRANLEKYLLELRGIHKTTGIGDAATTALKKKMNEVLVLTTELQGIVGGGYEQSTRQAKQSSSSSGQKVYSSEQEAIADGHKVGDVVNILVDGKVRKAEITR